MTTRLALNHWTDWLVPSNPNDSRLLHADRNDRVLVCPPHLGQGYIQEILLRDDLSLFIHDYTLDQNVVIDALEQKNYLEFEFQLSGRNAGYSFFVPSFGLKELIVKPAGKPFFKVEVIFKKPTHLTYFQTFMERFSPQTRSVADRVIESLYRYHGGGLTATSAGKLDRVLQGARSPYAELPIEQILSPALYSETIVFKYANRNLMTPVMEQTIAQILSCPYGGATRRRYLERQALTLVSLHLQGMVQPQLRDVDHHCIYEAASILRKQSVNPPTVDCLARQVYTNRLKLNQGFRELYGTTPFGYLRDCRLIQARQLLMNSDLSISNVAAAVGYTCRSKFASAFRQDTGINPKTYQMQAWESANTKNAFRHQNP